MSLPSIPVARPTSPETRAGDPRPHPLPVPARIDVGPSFTPGRDPRKCVALWSVSALRRWGLPPYVYINRPKRPGRHPTILCNHERHRVARPDHLRRFCDGPLGWQIQQLHVSYARASRQHHAGCAFYSACMRRFSDLRLLYRSATDFDQWSWSNQVGAYQTYIFVCVDLYATSHSVRAHCHNLQGNTNVGRGFSGVLALN